MLYGEHRQGHRDVPGGSGCVPGPPPARELTLLSHNIGRRATTGRGKSAEALSPTGAANGRQKRASAGIARTTETVSGL